MSYHLGTWFTRVLNAYHGMLGQALDQTPSSSGKLLYLQAIRELARKRETLERSFALELVKHYYAGVKPDGWYQLIKRPCATAMQVSGWDEDWELQLTDELIEKADEQYDLLLATLLSQYQRLLGANLTLETLPVSPEKICRAFNRVMAAHYADIDIKQQAYQCFEDILLDAMALVYLEIYEYLAQEGVLSQTPLLPAVEAVVQRPTAVATRATAPAQGKTRARADGREVVKRLPRRDPAVQRYRPRHPPQENNFPGDELAAGLVGLQLESRIELMLDGDAGLPARVVWKSEDGMMFLFELITQGRLLLLGRECLAGLVDSAVLQLSRNDARRGPLVLDEAMRLRRH